MKIRCGNIRHVYNGGVYHTTRSVFQRLDDEGITVVDMLRFYPSLATFEFNASSTEIIYPPTANACSGVSVSVASNVPVHETPRCYVTDGDSDKLMGAMMSGLSAISNAAFAMLIPSTITY